MSKRVLKVSCGLPAGTETVCVRVRLLSWVCPQLTFKTRFDIEDQWDYAQVRVNGEPIVGTIDGVPTTMNDNQYDATIGWDGVAADWVDAVFDLSAYAGQDVEITFAYITDPAVSGNTPSLPDGLFLDEIAVTGGFSDGAEAGVGDWDAVGWTIVGETRDALYPHYYIAGYRSYISYDQYLKTGPYYFGYGTQYPDKVDHYAYQQGLLISYFNTMYEDNDTFEHPGAGRNLYIDAHPEPFARSDGQLWRARIQVYDAPFGLRRTDKVHLHHDSKKETFGNLPGNPVFRDTDQYFFEELPNHGVILPGVGVEIRVLKEQNGKIQVKVN
jgi:immune inhibitor A